MNKDISLLYIDLFCGAGGTSTGVEMATIEDKKCAKIIACINHDKNAIASHESNHPEALHFTEDIRILDLTELTIHLKKCKLLYPSAKVVLWASLECTNFSKAKGGLPRDPDSRTLAEHLYRYIEALNPDFIQIENVEEFMAWGELDEKGKPVKMKNGICYIKWINTIQEYGYYYDFKILNSADFGAFTCRKRYFGQFFKTGLPIAWPEPTHSKNMVKGLFNQTHKWKAVKEVLELNNEGESIFIRKKPLVEATLERIYAGLIKFVAGGKDKWLLKYNSTNGNTGKHIPPSIEEPSPVITCQNRLGIVNTIFLTKYFSGRPEGKVIPITGPSGAIKTIDSHSIVNVNFLSAYYGNGHNNSINEPASTITTKDRLSMIQPKFLDQQYGTGIPTSIEKPCSTITKTPKQNLVSCKWLMDTNFYNSGKSIENPSSVITANHKWHYLMNPQFQSPGGDINNPCFTLIARMDKMPPYLITTNTGQVGIKIFDNDSDIMIKIKEFMALYGIIDIKMRMLNIPELKQIMGFPKDYILIGTKSEQKKYIGNAVEVNMAKALCQSLAEKIIFLNKENKITT